jgi:hypothetical protein
MYTGVYAMQEKSVGSLTFEEDRLTYDSLRGLRTPWKSDWLAIAIILLAILQLLLSATLDQ